MITSGLGATPITPAQLAAKAQADEASAASTLAQVLKAEAKPLDPSKVQSDAAQAKSGPILAGGETKKSLARQKIQQLLQELQTLSKLYGANPKALARVLTDVFKQLKSAVDDYRDGADGEVADAPQAADAAIAQSASQTSSQSGTATTTPPTTDPTQQVIAAADGHRLYAAVVQTLDQDIGNDGLDFLNTVRQLLSQIEQKIVAPTLLQAASQKPDKDTTQAFDDMGKALKDLKDDLSSLAQDIKSFAPTAGQTVSIAA